MALWVVEQSGRKPDRKALRIIEIRLPAKEPVFKQKPQYAVIELCRREEKIRALFFCAFVKYFANFSKALDTGDLNR